MGNPDELVDIVDENDEVLRVVPRREMRAKRLRHRGVFIAVIDSLSQLLIHKRADDKDIWPGRWDLCAGGVVAHRETYRVAAIRELQEELGLESEIELLGSGSHSDRDVDVVGSVYLTINDGPCTFNDGEVVATEWVSAEILQKLLITRQWCPDSVRIALPLILGKLAPT